MPLDWFAAKMHHKHAHTHMTYQAKCLVAQVKEIREREKNVLQAVI